MASFHFRVGARTCTSLGRSAVALPSSPAHIMTRVCILASTSGYPYASRTCTSLSRSAEALPSSPASEPMWYEAAPATARPHTQRGSKKKSGRKACGRDGSGCDVTASWRWVTSGACHTHVRTEPWRELPLPEARLRRVQRVVLLLQLPRVTQEESAVVAERQSVHLGHGPRLGGGSALLAGLSQVEVTGHTTYPCDHAQLQLDLVVGEEGAGLEPGLVERHLL